MSVGASGSLHPLRTLDWLLLEASDRGAGRFDHNHRLQSLIELKSTSFLQVAVEPAIGTAGSSCFRARIPSGIGPESPAAR